MERAGSQGQERSAGQEPVVVGLVAASGLPHELAEPLADELPGLLRSRYPEVEWKAIVRVEPLAGTAGRSADLVQLTYKRLLREGWKLAICLTDLPLHLGRRPVTAYASAALGVGVVSVPALGAVTVESRLRDAVLRLIRGLLGEDLSDRRPSDHRRRPILRRRLRELASPVGAVDVEDDQTVQFVTAAGRGNLRLLLGMVRANRPWRLVVGLSRVLVAALGTAAFGLSSPGIWLIADGMGPLRQALLTLASLSVTCVLLIAFHGLWEQSPRDLEARERVVLINLATATTVAIGIITLYLALFVINVVCGWALIAPGVLLSQVRHQVGPGDYVSLALLVTALATIASALGAALESAETVREAAYGYRPDETPDAGQDGR